MPEARIVSECDKCGVEIIRYGYKRKYCDDCVPRNIKRRKDIAGGREDGRSLRDQKQYPREVVSECERCGIDVTTHRSNEKRKYCDDCWGVVRAENLKQAIDSGAEAEMYTIECNYCGGTKETRLEDQKYCSKLCNQMSQSGIPHQTFKRMQEADV